MKRLVLVALMAQPAAALAWDDMQRVNAASALGDVMASESLCEMSYDPERIAAYIERTVPADDMEFAGLLRGMTQAAALQFDGMSASSKAAHCAQVRRVAKAYGFTG